MSSMKKAASRRPAGADLVPQPSLAVEADESRRGSHISDPELGDITVVVAVGAGASVPYVVSAEVDWREGDVEPAGRRGRGAGGAGRR